MKRTVLCFMLAFFAIALVSAQGNDRWGNSPRGQNWGQGPRGHGFHHGGPRQYMGDRGHHRNFTLPTESTRVSGNLTIVQGMIAVTDNDTTYLVRGLNRYIGFIDGLKEGAAVTLEGYALSRPQDQKTKFMQVQKMTLNGKDYELARAFGNDNEKNRSGSRNNQRQRGR